MWCTQRFAQQAVIARRSRLSANNSQSPGAKGGMHLCGALVWRVPESVVDLGDNQFGFRPGINDLQRQRTAIVAVKLISHFFTRASDS